MAIAKIQTGDNVKVIAGKYKNTTGQVLRVQKTLAGNGKTSTRVAVSGVPQIVKYRRAFTYNGESFPGSQYMIDRLIDISNLRMITTDGQTTGVKIEKQGDKKVRVMKKNGQVVVNIKVLKPKKVKQDPADKLEAK